MVDGLSARAATVTTTTARADRGPSVAILLQHEADVLCPPIRGLRTRRRLGGLLPVPTRSSSGPPYHAAGLPGLGLRDRRDPDLVQDGADRVDLRVGEPVDQILGVGGLMGDHAGELALVLGVAQVEALGDEVAWSWFFAKMIVLPIRSPPATRSPRVIRTSSPSCRAEPDSSRGRQLIDRPPPYPPR